ncbi:MAG: hypothetical protein AAFR27_13635, partial [Pseudomonadota bacterium]
LSVYWPDGDYELILDRLTFGDVVGFAIAVIFFFIMVYGCFVLTGKPKATRFGAWFNELDAFESIMVCSLYLIPLVEAGIVALMFVSQNSGAFAALAPVEVTLGEQITGYAFGLAYGLVTFFCAYLTAQSIRYWSDDLDRAELEAFEAQQNDTTGKEG